MQDVELEVLQFYRQTSLIPVEVEDLVQLS